MSILLKILKHETDHNFLKEWKKGDHKYLYGRFGLSSNMSISHSRSSPKLGPNHDLYGSV